MTIAYLNGTYLPLDQARISPLDRGFLFGDGIYEVIPSYAGRIVGGRLHAERLENGLRAIGISVSAPQNDWLGVVKSLIDKNQTEFASGNIGVYLHVSRGADTKRFHAYPADITPTIFAFAFEIPPSRPADREQALGLKVMLQEDLRWRRCHIKSTSLLGNVMHFQQSQEGGVNETILFNEQENITEASVCNVFAVIGGEVVTPPLDNQLLPGITRHLVITSLQAEGIQVHERDIHRDELFRASEVWLTSSSKEIAPVIEIEGKPVGDGSVGKLWERALACYHAHKFNL